MIVFTGSELVLIRLTLTTWERHPARADISSIAMANLKNLIFYFSLLFLFNDPGGQHRAVAIVMQLQREDQDVPVPAALFLGQVRQAAEAAVHVGFPRIRYGADDLFPLVAKFGKLFKAVLAGKEGAFLFIEPGEEFIHVLPDSITVKNFKDNVVPHGHGDARVKEISRIDHDWLAAALGFKRPQSRE